MESEKKLGSLILFEDEASLSNTATVSYSWGVIGKQPKIKQKQRKRERKTLFECIEPLTGKVITSVVESGNTRTFFKFLVKIVKQSTQKVILILDNVRYHHANRLKPILEKYKHKIELLFLPAYSPDLNPIERVWWYMRKKITHNRYIEKMENRIDKFNQLMKEFESENDLGKKLSNLNVNIY